MILIAVDFYFTDDKDQALKRFNFTLSLFHLSIDKTKINKFIDIKQKLYIME